MEKRCLQRVPGWHRPHRDGRRRCAVRLLV